MKLELGDDAMYLVIEVGPISFLMLLGDILELIGFFYVPGLTKNPLLHGNASKKVGGAPLCFLRP